MMKRWIPPLAALALVGAWIAFKQVKLRQFEREAEDLRARIERAEARPEQAAPAVEARGTVAGGAARSRVNWAKLGDSIARARFSGMPDMGGLMAMEEAVQGMTVDELYASLEEIESLELDGRAEQMLRSAVLGELVKKDPEGVVKRFFGPDLGPGDPNEWVIGNAFTYWAMEDPEAAQAWFDERIAAGDFEGKTLDGSNPFREQFERAVIGGVLAGDPAAAEERLLALPEVERLRVLALGNYTDLPREARPP